MVTSLASLRALEEYGQRETKDKVDWDVLGFRVVLCTQFFQVFHP